MKKRIYQKPKVEVVKLHYQSVLLDGSPEPEPAHVREYRGEFDKSGCTQTNRSVWDDDWSK